MDQDVIKNRDRWSCKACGHRFGDLKVLEFSPGEFITLCNTCASIDSSEFLRKLIVDTKVVFVGDCHGDFKRLDRVLTDEEPFDFFISVGDFSTISDMKSDTNVSIVGKWSDRGYFVRGNHDDTACLKQLELYQEIRNISVAGLNGMIRSKTFARDTHSNISFREILYLSHLGNVDILVTHQAPTGMFRKMGEPVLEELLNYLVPKIYIFGHIHKFKFKFHLNTFVISLPIITSGHAVAYFQGRDLRNIELVFKKGKKFVRV